MTTHLGESTVAGQIDTAEQNSVHGWIQLADRKHPLLLHLTGNVADTWRGKQIFFHSTAYIDWKPASQIAARPSTDTSLASHQVGPLFDFQAIKSDCGKLDGDGEFRNTRVRLEWAGQNGRIVVTIPDAIVDISNRWIGPHHAGRLPDRQSQWLGDETQPHDDNGITGEPDDGSSLWNQSAFEADVRIHVDEAVEKHFGLVDEMVEGKRDVPIHTIFDPPLCLRRSCDLDEDALEQELLTLLARLAEHGIALDMCEHFTLRQAYDLLLDEIMQYEVYPKLNETGFVQHYATFEYCRECTTEFRDSLEGSER